MLRYLLQRSVLMIPTLIGITIVSFGIMRLAPGDPVDLFLGGAASGAGLSDKFQGNIEKTRQELRERLGLDKPLYRQYLTWVSGLFLRVEPLNEFDRAALLADDLLQEMSVSERAHLAQLPDKETLKQQFLANIRRSAPGKADELAASTLWQGNTFKLDKNYVYTGAGLDLFTAWNRRFITLDFGRSFKDNQSVIGRILERLPVTLEINVIGIVIAYLVGVPMGIWLAVRQNSLTDRVVTTGTFILWSMPSFWVGMLLIIFFCNREFLYWFPASGLQSIDALPDWGLLRRFWDHIYHLFLPILASTYISFAVISRFMRTSVLENLRQDYVRTARAKGLPERTVILHHVYRNSLIPIVTTAAGLLPGLIAGSVFVETIFTVPGMGFLSFEAVLSRDYPMVMAIFTIGSVLSLLGILVSDVLLKLVDPRITFEKLQG